MLSTVTLIFKDDALSELADKANVAQFVSFDRNLNQRHARIGGYPADYQFSTVHAAVDALLAAAPEHKVNIRSFQPEDPRGGEFVLLLGSADEVISHLQRLSARYFTIVNESIDVNDGGVSGVLQGGLCEFAPGDTPRCVEREEVAALPYETAIGLLQRVYGISPSLSYSRDFRVEFSIHPSPRGFRHNNTIIWELQRVPGYSIESSTRWPNAYSRFVGDKVYGLLMADVLGFSVPQTKVLARHVAPFCFGRATGSSQKWLRTAPAVKTPGKYSTIRGFVDPFELMQREDPDGLNVSSVLVQDEVEAEYSGAIISTASGEPIIEGVKGFGDELMLGRRPSESIPRTVESNLQEVYYKLYEAVGPLRAEWAHDGKHIWILQLQQEQSQSTGNIIHPGSPEYFWDFDSSEGLEKLRSLIPKAQKQQAGIRVIGNIGMTSHIADVLRDAEIPAIKVTRTHQTKMQPNTKFATLGEAVGSAFGSVVRAIRSLVSLFPSRS